MSFLLLGLYFYQGTRFATQMCMSIHVYVCIIMWLNFYCIKGGKGINGSLRTVTYSLLSLPFLLLFITRFRIASTPSFFSIFFLCIHTHRCWCCWCWCCFLRREVFRQVGTYLPFLLFSSYLLRLFFALSSPLFWAFRLFFHILPFHV